MRKVVCWNIKFGERINQAIEELKHIEQLKNASILLLQELDSVGAERIAGELGYNYVYFPASIHHKTDREFGNAILSLWPIMEHSKILLPHVSPRKSQRRIVIGKTITIDSLKTIIYATHTETPFLSRSRRYDQIKSIANLLEYEEPYHAIVGGDFNTFSPRSIRLLYRTMAEVGLSPIFKHPKTTLTLPFLNFKLDHLFIRGFRVVEAGVWTGTKASDHYPIWTVIGNKY